MALFRADDYPSMSRARYEISVQYQRHYPEIKEHLEDYLKVVREDGPLSSLDFKEDKKLDWAWGSMRVAKAALETLFFSGKLGVHHRVNNRRYYDLVERLLPSELLTRTDPFSDDHQYRRWHIERRIRSAGIAGFGIRDFWYGIVHSDMKTIRETVKELVHEGIILKIGIEGSKRDWFIPADAAQSFTEADPELFEDSPAVLLAPLDNMMWNRELIDLLFDFRYRWEVYTPAARREYGYYVLPVLYRGKIIGRCEPVLDRKAAKLVLKGFWPEENTEMTDELIEALRDMFSRFCRFHGVKKMVTVPGLGRTYRSLLKGITCA